MTNLEDFLTLTLPFNKRVTLIDYYYVLNKSEYVWVLSYGGSQ